MNESIKIQDFINTLVLANKSTWEKTHLSHKRNSVSRLFARKPIRVIPNVNLYGGGELTLLDEIELKKMENYKNHKYEENIDFHRMIERSNGNPDIIARGGSGKLNSWDRWIFRATAA